MTKNKPFNVKLNDRMVKANTLVCVGLDPDPNQVPAAMRTAVDPVLAFTKHLIEQTAPYACVFKLNIAFYEALGIAGWQTLKGTIDAVPPEIPVILDAKRADIANSSEAYARALFEVLDVDAVTVSPYLGADSLEPFVRRADRGIFVLCHTSNPGATALQEMSCGGAMLYERIAELALSLNEHGNVGLVAGATYPEAIARLRRIAPTMPFLVPGVGTQGGDLEAAVEAAADEQGLGVVINSSRGIMYANDPALAAKNLRDAINAARMAVAGGQRRVLSVNEELVLELFDAGCIKFGQFKLHSGEIAPIYVDLRLLASEPSLLRKVARAFATAVRGVRYDRLAAIPYAAMPIGTALSLELGRPMIYPRREAKAYGTARAIEGRFEAGERALVVDDVITTGASKIEAIAPLQDAGLVVKDIAVLVDREQGGAESLVEQGYHVHSVLGLGTILETLLHRSRITAEQYEQTRNWLDQKRGQLTK